MPSLLILTLGLVCGTGLLFAWMTLRQSRQRHRSARPLVLANPVHGPTLWPPTRSVLGQQPCRWLAVKTQDPLGVQSALRLNNPATCSWAEGLARVHDRQLFITPPVRGWVLVLGRDLPDPSEDVDRCFHFIQYLSRKLGQVQFFSANRVVNHHCWVRAEQGSILRAYAWAGETLWNQGELTLGERMLKMKCFHYGEATPMARFSNEETDRPNAEKVVQLAAQWSVDPTVIEGMASTSGMGIAGHLRLFKSS